MLSVHQYEDPVLTQSPNAWDGFFSEGVMRSLDSHPLLVDCRKGIAPIAMLRRFLVQHQYYSRNFTRYLTAMMSSLPSATDLRELTHNLVEEMGLDQPNAITHSDLYQKALENCGVISGSDPILPATTELIETMFGYCRSRNPIDGLSALCFGAEAIVPTLYGSLLTGLRNAGITGQGLYFFELHVSEDEQHAITMRRIIQRLIAERPQRRMKAIAIADEMVALRMAVLDAVYY